MRGAEGGTYKIDLYIYIHIHTQSRYLESKPKVITVVFGWR